MGIYTVENNGPLTGNAGAPSSLGVDLATPALYVAGNSLAWTKVGSALPVASGAGQVPVSSGAGTTYTAQAPGMALISKQILLAAAATVTFAAIPQGYTNLKLVMHAASAAATTIGVQFNGDTGANYSTQAIAATGTSSFPVNTTGATSAGGSALSALPGTTAMDIGGYSGAVLTKGLTSIGGYGGGSGVVETLASSWNNVAAITQIDLRALSGTFAIGSSFSLYGLS